MGDNEDVKHIISNLIDYVTGVETGLDSNARKNRGGHMIPMSFEVMQIFQNAGFTLKEIIIKEQHNCRATGYWKTNSIKYNFLLIAHEYLFVFRK